jgi:GT2 family glycosyltransferase
MKVSIVIPTYNGKKLLEKNLPAVLESLRDSDELIIVDDASTDDTLEWLTRTYGLKHGECTPDQHTGIAPTDFLCYSSMYKSNPINILVNQANQRFASSCNRGVSSATNEIVILLNNDVSPQKDFISFLIPHFDQSRVFAVGCKEIASAEGGREYGRSEGTFKRGFYVHNRAEDQNGTDTAWVAGGSGAFRRSFWLDIGGFDLDFKPAYGEDIDLSFRARQKGWLTLFEPKSVVFHNHESTNASVFGQYGIEVMSYKNALLFMWKTAPLGERMKHLFWLPYHLLFTTLRSKGAFLSGFSSALVTILGIR